MSIQRLAIVAALVMTMFIISPASQGSRLVFNQTGTVERSVPYSGTIEINKVLYTLAKDAKIHRADGTTSPASYGLDRGTTVGFTAVTVKGKRVIHELWIIPNTSVK